MQLPRALARFNRHVTNPIQRLWAGRLPGFGIVEHVGRKSGRRYRTPLNVFRAPDGFVILLDYGSQTDWVRNVVAAGGGHVVHRGRRYTVADPQLLSDGPGRALLPAPIRAISRLARVDSVLRLRTVPGG
jgi:deazaflavin-dependent oxidoreductase (nitroreductase family)